MSEKNLYKDYCFRAIDVVKEAAAYIQGIHENRKGNELDPAIGIESKGEHNLVTQVDRHAEEILVKGLSVVLPEAGFITEEGTSTKKGELYNWIIDPIDGTTNFIHGAYPFSISVGLSMHEEVVAGIVYVFGLNETFYAWKGGGAWLNGESISVSNAESVNNSLIATGFPYTDFRFLDNFMESIRYFMKNSRGLRRLGSAAADIAYVACGRFDGFYEYGLNPWDIAAGIVLLKEAGGRVSDFRGHPDPLFSENLVCTNGKIHNEFQEVTMKIMLDK